MDLELIKKLEHFNIYANIGLQFDRIDKFEKYKHGQKKAFIDWINSAKTEQTKANRIAKTITMIQKHEKI